MKKNISINIGGIIFHIEEDGYERLQSYLSEINSYFKKYDDSTEIINDLEGRIAEIFSSKLDKSKEIITAEDVDDLIKVMGTVSDFEVIEDDSESFEGASQSQESGSKKKLYRDTKRKIIGGVCSGIAHYYGVDTLWARIIFLVMFFGFLVIPPASGLALVLYIAFWIALPGNDQIEEDKKVKKLYRNPDDKVISGVSSGLAAYFGVDVAIIRLIFVLSVLFLGSGIIIYLALWFITPEASTMTEKIQMKGDPVTLSNIETSVKKNLQKEDSDEENVLVTILLFPFRLIGRIFEVLGKSIGPLLEIVGKVLRILIGLFLMFVSFMTFIGLMIALGAVLGIYISPEFWLDGLPIETLSDVIPTFSAIAGLLALLIPSIALGLLGLRLITLRPVTNNAVSWSLFGIWIISSVIALSSIPAVIKNFSEEEEFVVEESYPADERTLVFKLNEVGMDSYDAVRLTIRPHEKQDIRIVKEFSANGRNRLDAIENAKMVTYGIEIQDSVYRFDSNIQFKEDADFRVQELDITMYIPLNQKFVMTEDLDYIIYRTIHYYDYRVYDMGLENVFVFENMEDLTCLTCEMTENSHDRYSSSGDYSKAIDVSGPLSEVKIKGAFVINLQNGEELDIELRGRKSKIEDIEFDYKNQTLEIEDSHADEDFRFKGRKPVYVNLVVPDIEKLRLYGMNDLHARDISYDDLELEFEGMNDADIKGEFGKLDIEAEGLSDIELRGSADIFNVELKGKADLEARDFTVREADVKAYGNADAIVTVTGYLNAEAAGFSEIDYYGNPRADEKVEGLSQINRR